MALSVSDILYGELGALDPGYVGSLSDRQMLLLSDESPPGGGDVAAADITDATATGEALITAANAAAALAVVGGQASDADLTALAALTTTAYGRAFLELANQAALMALVQAASDTVAGKVELATDAEALTGTDTARAITPANLQAKLNALLTGAPAALDTLDELAAALGDDASYAATITTALGLKAPLAGPTFTGIVQMAEQYRTGGLRTPQSASKTAAYTLALTDPEVQLVAPSSSYDVTMPATATPGHRFRAMKTDADTTKTVSFKGTFLPGSVTDFILRGLGQWVEFVTTSTSGTFQVIDAGPCVVPTGTASTGLTDGIQFVEYTP